jgi:hypothetical protein
MQWKGCDSEIFMLNFTCTISVNQALHAEIVILRRHLLEKEQPLLNLRPRLGHIHPTAHKD